MRPESVVIFYSICWSNRNNNTINNGSSVDNNNVNTKSNDNYDNKNNDNNDSCDTCSLSETDQLGLDFGILVSCDHLIISYSTLGMWAGHLNGGTKVMALGLEGYEEAVKSADFPNWHFFTDD